MGGAFPRQNRTTAQDRLDVLLWRLQQNGLQRRNP